MGTRLSAGTYIEERDISNNVVASATNVASYVGRSVWGSPNTRTLVTSEKEFADMFGEPTDNTFKDFFTVAGFLKYGQALWFVRAVNSSATNACIDSLVLGVSGGSGLFIKDWEVATITYTDQKFKFYAKYPGVKGSSDYKVSLVNKTAYDALLINPLDIIYSEVAGNMKSIEYGPTTNEEYIVMVQVKNSSDVFELLESFLVSTIENASDSFGNNIYIEQLINRTSKYIFAFNNKAVTGMAKYFGYFSFINGSDGTNSTAEITSGYDLFSNPEEIEINYLIGGNNNSAAESIAISNIAQTRKDCFSLHDVEYSDVSQSTISASVASVISHRTVDLTSLNTSYSALYANWFYIYDKYNDKNRWVPCTGYVAGIYANTADVADSWFAPAGLNRGIIKGVIKIAINPNKAFRDQMYQKQVNPIVSFPGQGTVVWGQKTLQTKPSAFDRVNVRLLFIYMEKAISNSAKYMVFEQNDQLLRAIFLNMVEPFMTGIKGRRGIYDYLIDVGDSVNTPEVIDQNEFHAQIFVKPTRVAESIVLSFVATKTGASFTEG